ncbi:MAG: SH3 domain-containing protein [Lachnospiraceae bacterium]|nr:SH3 domain-containing protein [Lachnospiraceae bacterium]
MKRNTKIFIALCAFYVLVALLALLLLNGTDSVFNRDGSSPGAKPSVMSQTIIGEVQEPETEPEPVAEEVSEPEETEPVETQTEEAVEEEVTEPEATEPEEETYPIRYFTFITDTKNTILRLREEPSETATILNKLSLQTPGYILKPGNEWCKVVMPTGTVGYCSTEYLLITEVTEDTYPAEFLADVEASEEELTAPAFTTKLIDGTVPESELTDPALGTENTDPAALDATAGTATTTDTTAAAGTATTTQ